MRLLALVALATLSTALPDMFMGRRRGGFTSHLLQNSEGDPSLLASDTFGNDVITQKQDHFDSSNTKTWKQRYFFNHAYVNSSVNILYLSGEQTGSVFFILGDANAPVYYAEQLSADLYSLEHRFYGNSHPTDDTSVENLKYLSSRQAIEDIAEFIRKINAEKGGDQKWIIVGGSYAGALSAWSRLKHPELIAGSIASSGPVLAQLDFYGYLQTVEKDFKNLGGICYDQISSALDTAQKLLQSEEGRENLTKLFKIKPPLSAYDSLSDYDIFTFFGYLIGPFEESAQYSNPLPEKLCQQLFFDDGEGEDPLQALADIQPKLQKFDVNFTASVEEMSGIEYKGDISMRLWFYQTCTEFGYFQSTNRGSNLFGQTQSSNAFIEYCVQLFGINADQIQKGIESVNQHYGERDYYAGTNVVFSHGTQDPWSFLTKKSDPKHWSVVIVEVEDGSHCQDIGQACLLPTARCTENMKQIQKLTLENMQRWVDPIFPVPDRVEITDHVGQRPQFFDPNVSPSLSVNVNSPDSVKIRAQRSDEPLKRTTRMEKWNKFTGKFGKGLRTPPISENAKVESTATKSFIDQTWDHFNPNEERTFKQKYYSQNKFGSPDGPNFLMIGGEGPENSYFIDHEEMAWMTYAKAVGANVFDLEHRYYGESKLGTNDLQYLTSAQMLYDVATFIRTQKVQNNLTGPWITFGGSYPGALAAWSREWFPELILGAVGSSGPVQAKNDFYEYLEVVQDVIKRQSQKCYDITADSFQTLEKLAQDPEGRATIQDKFKLEPAWTADPNDTIAPLDLNELFSALSGMYMGVVQYNSVDWSDVAWLCSVIEDAQYKDAVDALSALRYESYGDDALTIRYDADIEEWSDMKNFVDGHDHTYSDNDLAGYLWMWQTCNEFGYYQSTDYGDGIFGTPVPLNYYIIMCERMFGIGMDDVEQRIARTNYQYGGRNRYNATNVVLPNGDGDPWHALGLLEKGNLDDSVVPIVIKGTSHCADMYGADPADPPELTQARKTILENIQKWLKITPDPATTTQDTTTTGVTTKTPTTPPTSTVTASTVPPTTSTTSPASFLLAIVVAFLVSVV